MRHRSILLILTTLLIAAAASAQPLRTFVSSTGLDTNTCGRTDPCRNLSAAVNAARDGGEVIVLDSAGYGPLLIEKSVSIIVPAGVYGGITATSGAAITVNAPAATVVVRGLTLNGQGASYGVYATSAGVLHVERTVAANFTSSGVLVTAGAAVFIDGSVARGNAMGFAIVPFSGSAAADIANSRAEANSGDGFYVQGDHASATMAVHDCVARKNGNAGIRAYSGVASVRNCVISGSQGGVTASNGARIAVSSSLVAENAFGFFNADATTTFQSFRTNELAGNGTATSGSITNLGLQ